MALPIGALMGGGGGSSPSSSSAATTQVSMANVAGGGGGGISPTVLMVGLLGAGFIGLIIWLITRK